MSSYPPKERGKHQILGWMSEEKYLALKSNIKCKARIDAPMVYSGGELIDGYHRQLALEELTAEGNKIEQPAAINMPSMPAQEIRHYVLSANLCRRQFSREEVREIIKAELRLSPDCADAWIADICGVSDKTVTSVRNELESTSEIPTLDTFKKRDGKPYKRIITTRNSETRKAKNTLDNLNDPHGTTINLGTAQRMKRKEFREKIAARKTKPLDPSKYQLMCSDFKDMAMSEPVDLILTDPLYQGESLQDWLDLAKFAEENLKEGGVLVAYSGLQYLPQVFENLKSLEYVWTLAIVHSGEGTYVDPIQGRSNWRPVVVYRKGEAKISGIIDTIKGGGSEKDFHDYQQPLAEARYLIEKFSKPGDLVCDPFAGSFTTALGCYQTGRRFLGCDLSQANVDIGNFRLEKAAEELNKKAG